MLQPPGPWSPSITSPSRSLRSRFGQTRGTASCCTAMTQPARTSCLSTWQGATWSSASTVALGPVFSGKGCNLHAPPPPKHYTAVTMGKDDFVLIASTLPVFPPQLPFLKFVLVFVDNMLPVAQAFLLTGLFFLQ